MEAVPGDPEKDGSGSAIAVTCQACQAYLKDGKSLPWALALLSGSRLQLV